MSYRGSTPFILVVDDDVDLRAAVMLTLQEEGYHVVGANNGLEALKLLVEFSKHNSFPKLMLVDINMPILNGWELVKILCSCRQEIAAIPIYMVTASEDRKTWSGANGMAQQYPVLRKPYSIERLLEIAEKHISQAKGREEVK